LLRAVDRQRAQPHGVHELEDGRVGARAEREGEDGDGREGRIAAQQPRAVAQVLPEGFEEADRVHRVDLFADEGGVSEPAVGGGAGDVGAHPAGKVVVDFLREVRRQLARALVVPVAAAEEAGHPHRVIPWRGGGCG
jgi:hypothetical protein